MAKRVDWEAIEIDYRAGVKTLRQMAEEYGVSNGRIAQVAKKNNWPRDLTAKIKAKVEERLSKEAVSKELSKEQIATESQVVEANAKMQSDIILAHRTGIPNKRALVEKLCAEIECLTDNQDIVEQMVLALQSGDMDALAKAARKVSTLPSRIKGLSDLVGAYKILVEMERKAFGIDKNFAGDDEPITEIIRRIIK